MADREPTPGLYGNGAVDPDLWAPRYDNHRSVANVEVGDLVAWRYGAWRVIEVRPIDDVDLTDRQREQLDEATRRAPAALGAAYREWARPRHTILRHESGPLITKPGERGPKRLHDGTRVVSLTKRHGGLWSLVPEPYMACSCHGHIWPCEEIDQTAMAAAAAKQMDRAMATTHPGVCAACLEPITTRQKTVTFPEESRLVPGAPGPTFHAGRAACWYAAERYERNGRLKDNPDVTRIASCPGVRFIHEAGGMPTAQRVECTAGPACTGHHGPAGYRRDIPCWHQVDYAANRDAYARPNTDCGYRSGGRCCLGQHITGGGATNEIAGDLLWRD